MPNLLGLCGRQRSGKDTSINYITGCVLAKLEIIKRFDIDENGGLLVNAVYSEEGGGTVEDMGLIDLQRRDNDFVDYAEYKIWPHVKSYYFAEPLKQIAMALYGLSYDQVYGTTEQKLSLTNHQWKGILECIPKKYRPTKCNKENYLSCRQFMQYLGDVLREIHDECFVDVTLKQIASEQSALSLIGDCRREVEVRRVQAAGGKVIFLKRKTIEDSHRTEKELDTIDESIFDAVIDNQNMTIDERNKEIYSIVHSWGWIN